MLCNTAIWTPWLYLFVQLYSEHRPHPGYILTPPRLLLPSSSHDEIEVEFMRVCASVFVCWCVCANGHMAVCLCESEEGEREKIQTETKRNLSLNHTASPGGKAPLPGVSQ